MPMYLPLGICVIHDREIQASTSSSACELLFLIILLSIFFFLFFFPQITSKKLIDGSWASTPCPAPAQPSPAVTNPGHTRETGTPRPAATPALSAVTLCVFGVPWGWREAVLPFNPSEPQSHSPWVRLSVLVHREHWAEPAG